MDEFDYTDFDWDTQPYHIYDTDFRKKMVREFKIEKNLALKLFFRLESAAVFSSEAAIGFKERPSEKAVRDSWMSVSSSAQKLLDEVPLVS